jgi:hypothetical protein
VARYRKFAGNGALDEPFRSFIQEERVRRIALAAALAVASFGSLAGSASADPVASICGSIKVTVNGEAVVDQAQCQVLPPEGH